MSGGTDLELEKLRIIWQGRGLTAAKRKEFEERAARMTCAGEELPPWLIDAVATTIPADRKEAAIDSVNIKRLTIINWQLGGIEKPTSEQFHAALRAAVEWLREANHKFGNGDAEETLRMTWRRHGDEFREAIRLFPPL